MPSTPRETRRSYSKGDAKRAEIIDKTLEVIGTQGFRGASLRELAEAVGTTQASVLYHFGTKEDLFTEVLRRRSEIDHALIDLAVDEADPIGGLGRTVTDAVQRNTDVPGLVHLFSQLAVDSIDPSHPANAFFLDHRRMIRDAVARTVQEAHETGELPTEVDSDSFARMVQALLDGLQLQWLQDPSTDMAALVTTFFTALKQQSTE